METIYCIMRITPWSIPLLWAAIVLLYAIVILLLYKDAKDN